VTTADHTPDGVLPSPCIGVCHLDAATGWCVGCGRAGDELFGWGELAPERQRAIWAKLPARMAALRRPTRVLPWNGAALLARLRQVTAAPGTVWSLGGPGASAEFMASPHAALEVEPGGDGIRAQHPDGALRVVPRPGLRGFVRGGDGAREIVVARYRPAAPRPTPRTVADLGFDGDALTAAPASARLFDLGLGQPSFRFCVRVADARLGAMLAGAVGRALGAGEGLAAARVDASPPRIVMTGCARCEVTAPIPSAAGATPAGPHTHVLPERMRPPGWFEASLDLPAGYAVEAQVFASSHAWRDAGLDLEDG